jgi:hypothetical protein
MRSRRLGFLPVEVGVPAALGALVLVAAVADGCGSASDRPPPSQGPTADGGTDPASLNDAAGLADAPPSVIVAGPVISSQAGLYEIEPDVAVGPGGLVAAAFMAQGPGSLAYAFSHDDGATWGPPAAIVPPVNGSTADPSLAADGAGGFLLTYLTRGAGGRHIYAATAPSGTTTFGSIVEVSDPAAPAEYDKPWALVLADGTRLIVYTTDNGSAVYVARSADAATWTRTTIAPDGMLRGVAFPCATANRLYVTYLVPGGIRLSASDDGGATWPVASTTVVQGPGEHTAFDMPTCVASGDDVWIAYGLTNDTNNVLRADELTAIRIAHSKDGGKTIDARTSAGSTAGNGAGRFMHPHLVRDAAGTLHILYYAGTKAGDRAASMRHARSMDFGATWTASESVGPPITFITSRTGLDWLGDYLGATALGSSVYTTYVQNQPPSGGSVSHVAFAKIDPPR